MIQHDLMAHPGYDLAAQAMRDARDLREALGLLAQAGAVPEDVPLSDLKAAIADREIFSPAFRGMLDRLLATASKVLESETRIGVETFETGCDGASAYADVPVRRLTARGELIAPAVFCLRGVVQRLDLLLDAIAAARAIDQLACSN